MADTKDKDVAKDLPAVQEDSSAPEVVTQINAVYEAGEDRIVLRATSNLQREFKLWLTFRIFRLLNDAFEKIDNNATPAHMPEQSREAVKEFHREQTLKKANFTKGDDKPKEELDSVFGEKPLLVDTIKIQIKPENEVVILTFCGEGKECSIPLTRDALIPTRHLIERAAVKGEWIEGPTVTQPEEEEKSVGKDDNSDKILH